MKKTEMTQLLKKLKAEYPDGTFDKEVWWERYKNFDLEPLLDAVDEWKRGMYGYKAPDIHDIRSTHSAVMWDPEGIFYKAIMDLLKEDTK